MFVTVVVTRTIFLAMLWAMRVSSVLFFFLRLGLCSAVDVRTRTFITLLAGYSYIITHTGSDWQVVRFFEIPDRFESRKILHSVHSSKYEVYLRNRIMGVISRIVFSF